MIAVANLIPDDPDGQRTVLSVLDAHPQGRGFVARSSAMPSERACWAAFLDARAFCDTESG